MKTKTQKLLVFGLLFTALFLGTIIISQSASAQDETTDAKRTEEYCTVLATSNLLGTKVSITIDKGQEVKLFKNTGAVRDDEGKLKKFNTVIDALNYMNEDGWTFVDAYVVTVGQQNVYHYMMKRMVVPTK